jgi:hypothetical protein
MSSHLEATQPALDEVWEGRMGHVMTACLDDTVDHLLCLLLVPQRHGFANTCLATTRMAC